MYCLFLFVLTFYLVSYFPPLIDILTLCDYIKIEDVNVSLLTESPFPCWNIKYNIQYITVSTSQLFIGQCRSRYIISLIIEEAYRRNKIDVNKYINTEDDEHNIVRIFVCICGMCFYSILKCYVFPYNFYNIVSRLLKDILLMS
jgi:hypothetical protein